MCEKASHLLWRCLGDRLQISLFVWGCLEFTHRWGSWWRAFIHSLVQQRSAFPTLDFSSSWCWVRRGQRWQVCHKEEKKKKGKSPCSFCFSSSRLKKKKFVSCSLSYKPQHIFRSVLNTQGSKWLSGKQIQIRVCWNKCEMLSDWEGQGRRAVKLARKGKDQHMGRLCIGAV